MSNNIQIATWSDLTTDPTPEQTVLHLLDELEGGRDAYDILAVQRAYRQSVESTLPAELSLRGSDFYGPPSQHHGYTALNLHHSALDEAMWGPFEGHDDDAFRGDHHFQQIAAPYRITPATTRLLYATWPTLAGEESVEVTVRAALSVYGRTHVEALADSGRYDFETLGRAVSGGFGSDEDVTEVAAAYRQSITDALPDGYELEENLLYGPYPRREVDHKTLHKALIKKAVNLDEVIAAHLGTPPRELWSADQVAEAIGASSTDSARRTLSRWDVKAADYRPHPNSGRAQALYDAAQVRAAHATRPGRGARTDRQA
ncbi:hypothetical protein [Streptomyces sp. NBC_00280]|uniref:hypothetical protein n=1 Tax=Streptomyces sp. NBC_00280 TaxID=2975699 RepID=UPI002F916E90